MYGFGGFPGMGFGGFPGMGYGGGAYAAAGVGSWWGIGAVVVGILILIAIMAIFCLCC